MSGKHAGAATALITMMLAISLAGCKDSSDNSQNRTVLEQVGTAVGLNNDGPGTSREYKLSGFTSIELAGGDDVDVRKGTEFQIRARGPANALDQLDLRVENGVLKIGRKQGGETTGEVEIDLVMPQLSGAKLTGSGDLDADVLSGDTVALHVTGSGDLTIDRLTAAKADLLVTGSGELDVKGGKVDSGTYRVTGSGDLDAEKLSARSVALIASGAGDLEAFASGKADIRISGSGDVKVKGGAPCTTKISGSGKATCV